MAEIRVVPLQVLVGAHLVEIQTLTEVASWKYVDSTWNDLWHILTKWSGVPPSATWPVADYARSIRSRAWPCWTEEVHLHRHYIRGSNHRPSWSDSVPHLKGSCPDYCHFLHGTAASSDCQTADSAAFISAEKLLVDQDSFLGESMALETSRPIKADSRPATLSPEDDDTTGLLHVGGILAACKGSRSRCYPSISIVLLIQDFDHRLLHPGPGQVLAKRLARRCLGGNTGHRHFDYAACSTNGTSWVQTPPDGLVLGAHRLKSTALVQRDCSWRFLSKSGHAWPQAERYSNSKSDNQ